MVHVTTQTTPRNNHRSSGFCIDLSNRWRAPPRILLFAVLALISTPALAAVANWVEVGTATNGVRALVDTDTIIAKPDSVEVQQRFVLPAGATRRIAYVDQHVVYRCSSKTVKTLRSTEFDSTGRALREESEQQNPVYKVLDGTLPRYILDVLCE